MLLVVFFSLFVSAFECSSSQEDLFRDLQGLTDEELTTLRNGTVEALSKGELGDAGALRLGEIETQLGNHVAAYQQYRSVSSSLAYATATRVEASLLASSLGASLASDPLEVLTEFERFHELFDTLTPSEKARHGEWRKHAMLAGANFAKESATRESARANASPEARQFAGYAWEFAASAFSDYLDAYPDAFGADHVAAALAESYLESAKYSEPESAVELRAQALQLVQDKADYFQDYPLNIKRASVWLHVRFSETGSKADYVERVRTFLEANSRSETPLPKNHETISILRKQTNELAMNPETLGASLDLARLASETGRRWFPDEWDRSPSYHLLLLTMVRNHIELGDLAAAAVVVEELNRLPLSDPLRNILGNYDRIRGEYLRKGYDQKMLAVSERRPASAVGTDVFANVSVEGNRPAQTSESGFVTYLPSKHASGVFTRWTSAILFAVGVVVFWSWRRIRKRETRSSATPLEP